VAKLHRIFNASPLGRQYISDKALRRYLKNGRAILRPDGAVQFAPAVAIQAAQVFEPDRDSAHIYVADRWSFPHTQFAIKHADETDEAANSSR
jgi:hypothetical protein